MAKVMLVFLVFVLIGGCGPEPEKPIKAAVVSAHIKASEAGTLMLKKGGNAIDAAVATQFALAVTYPVAGNIGGGGFAVIHHSDGSNSALDFREKAPQAYHRDVFLDSHGNVVKDMSLFTVFATGVPGSVDGMWQMHKKHGQLEWSELLQPAIQLAENGFALSEAHCRRLNEYRRYFEKYNLPEDRYLMKAKEDWQPGELLVQQDLASLLKQIAEKGRDGFYKGQNANQLVDFVQSRGGTMTKKDLESYEAVWRDPYQFEFDDHQVVSMPLPSSGGLLLHQILRSTELLDIGLDTLSRKEYVHLLSELERRAYADRSEFLGDPDFNDKDLEWLVSDNYLSGRVGTVSKSKASVSDSIFPGEPPHESMETTHFSVVDQYGNAVSITTTINAAYGSRIFVPGMGYVLNNEMDDFSAKPGVPNFFGLRGSEANAVQGGKRPLSSMTPTIVLKDGDVKAVMGSPGGSTIITTVLQAILNVTIHEMGIEEAVAAPRFHHQWKPDRIVLEERALDSTLINYLLKLGHDIDTFSQLGNVNAIMLDEEGNVTIGADPRAENAYSTFR